ncbi:MAG TPA: GAF domain-containing SpoIIE family protein phosphatase [Acidothermaceae bacterium]|nr:GAF domain-containing SpoIIE family protein phosphatase [Acidothermaceae bacterium]
MSTIERGQSRPADDRLGQELTVPSGLVGNRDEVSQLLEQARRCVEADESALLLLDAAGGMLVPATSLGLDRPAHSGLRVPVGAGFAGRIAATGRPLTLADARPESVLNPALHRAGIKSLLGVPVSGPTGLLGVVHVGSMTRRIFTEQDIVQLEHVAGQLAIEVLRRRTHDEHIAALALQRSLLPTAPRLEGLDVAARYVPADGDLGGDWYDLFRLPGERIGIVMGDVAGHGLPAAVIMGRLRSALRAYALEHDDPAHVLRLLDMKISYFEDGAVATVLYAVADRPYNRFVISSAGHLPPYLVLADGSVSATDVLPDPPLGVRSPSDDSWSRQAVTVNVPAGASLCMFTDGLVERRPTPGEREADQLGAGLSRLVEALHPGDADAACDAVLKRLVGDDVTEDDIAVLVLRPLTA